MGTVTVLMAYSDNRVAWRNLSKLDAHIRDDREASLECIVLYQGPRDLAYLHKRFPRLRFWRISDSRSIAQLRTIIARTRGKRLVYVASHILVSIRDIYYLASALDVPGTMVSSLRLDHLRPLLKKKGDIVRRSITNIWRTFRFWFIREVIKLHETLNSRWHTSSMDLLGINVGLINLCARKLSYTEKRHWLRQDYLVDGSGHIHFDYFIDHLLQRFDCEWSVPGRAHSTYFALPTSSRLLLLSYRSLAVLWRKSLRFRKIARSLGPLRFLLPVSHLSFILALAFLPLSSTYSLLFMSLGLLFMSPYLISGLSWHKPLRALRELVCRALVLPVS